MIYVIIILVAIWIIVLTQGAVFGNKIVIWFYNRGAFLYDTIKKHDDTLIVEQIRELITPTNHATVAIDLAAGTGRAGQLLKQAGYEGTILGIDASRKMLNLNRSACKTVLANLPTVPIAPDSTDICISLEALEYVGVGLVKEAVRILRPGGHLIISNRTQLTAFLPGRCFTNARFQSILASAGLDSCKKIATIRYYGVTFYSVFIAQKGSEHDNATTWKPNHQSNYE